MEIRKIQKSGTTYYLYLPASWCREHKITTESTVFLERSSKGELIVQPKKTESNLSKLKLELQDSSPEVVNMMIIASYINPVKEFQIKLKEKLSPDQILEHKKILGGLELVDIEDDSISCQTSLALNDPDIILKAMIKKIIGISKLIKKDSTHELIKRYEEEIDKSNLLVQKSILSSLMYRRESGLRHADLLYIGSLSRLLERITDILITSSEDISLINEIESMMKSLYNVLENFSQQNVIDFTKKVGELKKIEVKDLATYKKTKVYSSLEHIAEILCDWVITDIIDLNGKKTYIREYK